MNAGQEKMDFVILAAGGGKRFSSANPSSRRAKQFELLAGRMVLLHSLDTISQWPSCGQIVIVLPQDGADSVVHSPFIRLPLPQLLQLTRRNVQLI